MASYVISPANYGYFTETVTPDYTITNNLPSTSITINLTSLYGTDLVDADIADSNQIKIDSVTLVNFRGCGSGDNNHALLTLSTDHKSVTYTPRANFYGRAQFGFNITDGKEDGSLVVITINVLKGTNVSSAPGANMVCNPGFEEGTEVSRFGADEIKTNSAISENLYHEGKWNGIHFADSHPYCFSVNFQYIDSMMPSSGIIIENSSYSCGILPASMSQVGTPFLSCPSPSYMHDHPYPSTGQRYEEFRGYGSSFYLLSDTVKHCKRYKLEFDGYWPTFGGASRIPLTIGLADTITNIITTAPVLNFMFHDTVTLTSHSWVHYTIPFNYCPNTTSTILYIANEDGEWFSIDNITLKEDTTATPLSVTITQSPPVPCTRTLTAHITNPKCSLSYLWTTTGGTILTSATDSSISVPNYITATYTVTVNDGCRTASGSDTVEALLPTPITGITTVCAGSTTPLNDSITGGTWSSSNTLIATVGSTNGIVTGVAVGTAIITYNYCTHITTITVTVIASVPAITGVMTICHGATTTLSDASPGGIWSSTNTAIATIGSLTGIVTGISGGIVSMTYTLSPFCFATTLVTIDTFLVLGPISSLAFTECVGVYTNMTYLYYLPGMSGVEASNGTWTSSNSAVASIFGTGIGYSSGVIHGVSAGAVTITYSVINACGTSITTTPFTVLSSLPAISGPSRVCPGSTITLTDGAIGGYWISSTPSVATVGGSSGIVTGISAGIDTVTYSLGSICVVTKVITVNPSPLPITGLPTVCIGMTTSLSDPSVGGTWTSSATLVATVGSGTGIVTGIAAGTATITYTLPGGCYTTIVCTVSTHADTIAGLSSICLGTSTTLTDASPGGTWSSISTGIAIIDSSTGIVTGVGVGSAAIDYTVSSTGCFITFLLHVTPLPAAISGPTNICMGSNVGLTDTTLYGTWSSSSTTVATIGSSTGIVTGISIGTTTITYKLPTGCYNTTVMTVNDTIACTPCRIFDTSSYIPLGLSGHITSNVGPGYYYIANNVTVTNNDTFTNAIIMISPWDTIYIDTAGSLTLDSCHLFNGCDMWRGMELKPGVSHSGRLFITNNSLIEDAMCAVHIPSPATPASGYVFKSDGAIYNRNEIGIYIQHYTPNIPTYPFLVRNTVITSRDFQTHNHDYPRLWPPTLGIGGLKNYYATDTFSAPYNINNPSPGLTYTYTGVSCVTGMYPINGIRLDSVGTNTPNTSIHASVSIPASYAEIVIGDATTKVSNQNANLFDNLNYGIFSINSNLTSVNNAFTNMFAVIPISLPTGIPSNPGGDGIYAAETDDIANENRLRVYTPYGSTYQNKFYGFEFGVQCVNLFQLIGQNTYMINKYYGTLSLPPAGAGGYYIATAKYDTIDISGNTITNVNTGVAVNMAYDPTVWIAGWGGATVYPSQYMGFCTISSNRIQAHPVWTAPLTTQLVNFGISYQNLLMHLPPLWVAETSNNLYIGGNTIHDAYNGIYVNNYWASAFAPFTEGNTIYMRQNATTGVAKKQYGINNTNCFGSYVFWNAVWGTVPGSQTDDSMRAFYSAANSGMNMSCNNEGYVGRGYEFFLGNPGTAWHNNYITNNIKGMVLNAATIGPQHYPSQPTMNNQWLGSWPVANVQTYVYHGADAYYSPFYVQTGGDTDPTANSGPLTLLNYLAGRSIFITSAGLLDDCYGSIGAAPVTDTANLFTLIAEQHISYTINAISNNWMGQYALWKSALTDNTLADSSAVLAKFVALADSQSRYKYLTQIETALSTGDFATASTMLGYGIDAMANTAMDSATQVKMADDTTADYIVENYREFYSLYLKYMNMSMSGSDSLNLLGLASLCPERNGAVVFQARGLYSIVFSDLSAFNDDSCLDVDTTYIAYRHSQNNNGHVNDGAHDQRYSLFPNPNDGNFRLEQYVQDTGLVNVTISDVVGRTIFKNKCMFVNRTSTLSLQNYSPGMYLVEITDSKKRIFRLKFVIDK